MEGNEARSPNNPRRRKEHRLPPEAYRGHQLVAFTACTRRRIRGLANAEIVAGMVPLLTRATQDCGCTVPIYTFMPDHLHVLILGTRDDSDAKSAMDEFKTLSGKWLARRGSRVAWQKNYYDRIIDGYGRPDFQIPYTALNPVRADLVPAPLDWPYTGSIGHDLQVVLGIKRRGEPTGS